MAENQTGVAQQALSLMHGLSGLIIPEDQRAETYALLEKIAPNMRPTPNRSYGESEISQYGGLDMNPYAGSPHADNPDQADAERVRAYRHNALLELKDTEYFNRKAMLTDPKYTPTGAGPINPFISGMNNGLISTAQMDQILAGRGSFYGTKPDELNFTGSNADFDGNALGDIVPPHPTPIPGFPLDELVNLPRFIMADVGPFAFVNEPQYKPTNLRLPYPKILFELGPEDNRHMVVVTQRGTHGFDFSTEYLHTDKDTPFEVGAMSHVDLSHGAILEINQMVYQTDPAVAEWTLMAIIGFIAEFSVGNTIIGTQARDPNRVIPQPGTTRKYRIVRVVMGVTKVCKPWQGGTHASPREHERMGHWRRVKGEPRWFPAVTVNKGVIGRVMKEYHVNHRNKPSPAIQGPEA